MKKIRFLLVLLVALLATGAKAENVQYLVLDLADGSQTVVALADQPVINCQNGLLTVTVGDEERLSASLFDVKQYGFSADTPTAIQNIETIEPEKPRIELGHVYISKAQQGETVRVFSADGKLVLQQRISDDGTTDIDLTQLGKGLYIVKSKNSSIKVINK